MVEKPKIYVKEDEIEAEFGAVPKDWNKAPPEQRDEIDPSATPKFRLKDRGALGDDVTDTETDLEPLEPGAKLELPKPVTKGGVVDDESTDTEPFEADADVDSIASYSSEEKIQFQNELSALLATKDVGKHQSAFADAIAKVENSVQKTEVENLISGFPKKKGSSTLPPRAVKQRSLKGVGTGERPRGRDSLTEEEKTILQEAAEKKRRAAAERERDLARDYGENLEERKQREATEYEKSLAKEYGHQPGEEIQGLEENLPREALPKPPGMLKRLWYAIPGNIPPRPPEVDYLLSLNRPLTPQEARLMLTMRERQLGVRAEARELGLESRWLKFGKQLNKLGQAAIVSAATTIIFAAGFAAVTTGVAALPALATIITAASSGVATRGMRMWLDKKGASHPFLKSASFGMLVGLLGGSATAVYDSLTSGVPTGVGIGTGSPDGTPAPTTMPPPVHGMPESMPVTTPGAEVVATPTPGTESIPTYSGPTLSLDYASPTISGGESVWSSLVDGLENINGLTDIGYRGREAFAHAFERVVNEMGLKGELLGEGLERVSWKAIPDGTTINFANVFENKAFVDRLGDLINSDYKTLVGEIGGRGNVKTFLNGVAEAYIGAK